MCGDDFICSMECGLLVYLYFGSYKEVCGGEVILSLERAC